nr:MAG TPA: hypothetical protein [Caudoviricetes sp.]
MNISSVPLRLAIISPLSHIILETFFKNNMRG